ncbi:MAG: OB-fold nucleic acid binding domain-containing protein, partial [Syntrophomonadaceae bacterium]
MSETEEQDLPFARSSIAAIGSRRRWRFFGGIVEDESKDGNLPAAAASNGDDDGPPGQSILGVFSGPASERAEPEAADRFLKEAAAVADEEPPVRSMLGSLADEAGPSAPASGAEAEGPATMLSLGDTAQGPGAETDDFGHLTQHSTIAELAGLEEHVTSDWPIERGVLISLLFHISLMLMLLIFPARLPKGGDLFAMLQPPPKVNDGPIPVILDAPGMPRHEEKVRVAGLITSVRPYTTKTNKPMGFVTIEDVQGNIELVLFPRTWAQYREQMTVGQIIIVEGKADTNSN